MLPKGDHAAPPAELDKFSRFCEECCRIQTNAECKIVLGRTENHDSERAGDLRRKLRGAIQFGVLLEMIVDFKFTGGHHQEPISAAQMTSPTTFLKQLPKTQSTAQYHFSDESLALLVDLATRFKRVRLVGENEDRFIR